MCYLEIGQCAWGCFFGLILGSVFLLIRKIDNIDRKKSLIFLMSLDKKVKLTPLMKQYNQIKVKYPDALLLFRVGDFYETFGEDAIKASKILGIILTKKGAGSMSEIELAGFPYHSINNYLPKLVKAGCRVAICDQLENPKLTKKLKEYRTTTTEDLIDQNILYAKTVSYTHLRAHET